MLAKSRGQISIMSRGLHTAEPLCPFKECGGLQEVPYVLYQEAQLFKGLGDKGGVFGYLSSSDGCLLTLHEAEIAARFGAKHGSDLAVSSVSVTWFG